MHKVLFFSIDLPTLISTAAILTGMRWSLTAVLICISLMIEGVDHLFVYLLSHCMPSVEKCNSSIFNWAIYLLEIFSINPFSNICEYFLPLPFSVFCCIHYLHFNVAPLGEFALLGLIWFWYQGNYWPHRMSLDMFPLLQLFGEFEKD